jgi:hypothetical protein
MVGNKFSPLSAAMTCYPPSTFTESMPYLPVFRKGPGAAVPQGRNVRLSADSATSLALSAGRDCPEGFTSKFRPLLMTQEVKLLQAAPWGPHP